MKFEAKYTKALELNDKLISWHTKNLESAKALSPSKLANDLIIEYEKDNNSNLLARYATTEEKQTLIKNKDTDGLAKVLEKEKSADIQYYQIKIETAKKENEILKHFHDKLLEIKDNEGLVMSISPYSNSAYAHKEGEEITWGSKPDNSYRLADHWNFSSRGEIHCKSDSADSEWYIAKYNAKKGIYERQTQFDYKEINSEKATLEVDNSLGEENIKYSLRTKPAPKAIEIAYKVFNQREDGNLYPLYINPDNGSPFVEIGKWYDADAGEYSIDPQNGRKYVKAQGGLQELAYRPGWHSGSVPYLDHIGIKGEDGKKYLPRNFVWAEVEVSADKNYQDDANARSTDPRDKALDYLPTDGYYKYKTNANAAADQEWYISGALKVLRILTDAEAYKISGKKTLRNNNFTKDIKVTDRSGKVRKINNTVHEKPRYSLAEQYSYKTLSQKPDMKITVFDKKLPLNEKGDINRTVLKYQAIFNVRAQGNPKNTQEYVYAHCNDTETDIRVGSKAITHGLDRRIGNNAKATLIIGNLINNAIRVNEVNSGKAELKDAYILLSVFAEKDKQYAVNMYVDTITNNLLGLNVDILYSVNAKKMEAARFTGEVSGKALPPTASTINISTLLEKSNILFKDIFSKDIYEHFGNIKDTSTKLGETTKYSLAADGQKIAKKLYEGITDTSGLVFKIDGDTKVEIENLLVEEFIKDDGISKEGKAAIIADKIYKLGGFYRKESLVNKNSLGKDLKLRVKAEIKRTILTALAARKKSEIQIAPKETLHGKEYGRALATDKELRKRVASDTAVGIKIAFVDTYAGAERALIRGGVTRNEAQSIMQNSRTAYAKAQAKLGNEQIDTASEIRKDDIKDAIVGKGLQAIFKPIKARNKAYVEDFYTYLAEHLNIDRMKQGKEVTGNLIEDSKSIIATLERAHPEFIEKAKEVWGFCANELRMDFRAGIISAERYTELKEKYPHYVPSYRDIDDAAR